MPIFVYQAVNDRGRSKKGYVEADSEEMAKEKLRAQKLLVTLLETYVAPVKEKKIPTKTVLAITQDLSQLLKAGLPLYDSLLMIEEKYRETPSHLVLLDLCDQVKGGVLLSSALTRYSKSFDPVYIAMVTAGERSANLGQVFDELTLLITRTQKLKKQLSAAMIYPAFIGSFCLVVISVLLFFLVPSMAQLFDGRPLHPMTAAILGISQWCQAYGIALFIGLASVAGALSFCWNRPRVRNMRAKIGLKLPIIKEFTTQAVMIRFTRTLGNLLDSGVPLLEGLQLSRCVMQNPIFESALQACESRIVEGRGLAAELKVHACFPKTLTRMLAIAEESGSSVQMFKHIADLYTQELEKNITRLTAYLQPIILLTLGLIVGVILLAVLLPLTDVSSFLET